MPGIEPGVAEECPSGKLMEVTNRTQQEFGVVVQQTDALIASSAQEPADLTCESIMVDGQVPDGPFVMAYPFRPTTDGAYAILLGKHSIIVIGTESVRTKQGTTVSPRWTWVGFNSVRSLHSNPFTTASIGSLLARAIAHVHRRIILAALNIEPVHANAAARLPAKAPSFERTEIRKRLAFTAQRANLHHCLLTYLATEWVEPRTSVGSPGGALIRRTLDRPPVYCGARV